MILHLAEDEKFIDHVIEIFEEVSPNKNLYFIQTKVGQKRFRYIKSKHKNIICSDVSSSCEKYRNIVKSLERYDAVVLHNFYSPYKQDIVRNAKNNIHFHWMSWGADLYSIPELIKYNIHKEDQHKSKITINKKVGDIVEKLFPNLWFQLYLRKRGLIHPNLKKALALKAKADYMELFKKIKSASTVLPSEMEFVWKYLNPKIKYLPFKYVTLESLTNGSKDICFGKNILIGNSATRTNNFLQLLKIIKNKIGGYQYIYMPLSYGEQKYADEVIIAYKEEFNKKFIPLLEFLSINQYNKILNSCGTVIMNHKRQQAIGNIVLLLYKGAYVYLHPKNPAFKYFKKNGIKVFEIDDFNGKMLSLNNQQLATHNRKILERLYSKVNVLEEAQELVQYLTHK